MKKRLLPSCLLEEPGREETVRAFGTDRNGDSTGLPEETRGGTQMTPRALGRAKKDEGVC